MRYPSSRVIRSRQTRCATSSPVRQHRRVIYNSILTDAFLDSITVLDPHPFAPHREADPTEALGGLLEEFPDDAVDAVFAGSDELTIACGVCVEERTDKVQILRVGTGGRSRGRGALENDRRPTSYDAPVWCEE